MLPAGLDAYSRAVVTTINKTNTSHAPRPVIPEK